MSASVGPTKCNYKMIKENDFDGDLFSMSADAPMPRHLYSCLFFLETTVVHVFHNQIIMSPLVFQPFFWYNDV